MSERKFVTVFASDTPEYQTAFDAFLDHTDQKANAFAWLSNAIAQLANRRVLIDAGAGNGQLTARLVPQFGRVIAIEPNLSLVSDLRLECPHAEVHEQTIMQAEPGAKADFILCSHILYYIPLDEWLPNTLRLAEWLQPGGVLAIAIQNPGTDCMKMGKHFIGGRLDGLAQLKADFAANAPPGFAAELETVPAHIQTDDLETACVVAEFILNVQPMKNPPAWKDLEEYVEKNFQSAAGGYRYSCHQDFLRIVRK